MQYWKRYDQKYKKNSVKKLYYFILSKAKKLGKPFERKSKRGRPLAISSYDYVATFIIASLFDWSLRDDELFSELLFRKHIDHSTFGKAFARIPYRYLKKLLVMIRNEINNLIVDQPVLISDSTGVKVDRLCYQTTIKCKAKKRRINDKMSILGEYYPKKRAIIIANTDAFFPSDSFSAIRMLNEIETRANMFFADAGFDSEGLFKKCFRKNILPMIKLKRHNKEPKRYRRKALEMFDEEVYKKYRGVIEGVFGGLETRRLLFTRYRKTSMRMKHIIAMAIVHNLQTYMAILFFILIYSTTPKKWQS